MSVTAVAATVIGLGVAAIAAALAAFALLQDRLIFFPQPLQPAMSWPEDVEPLEIATGEGVRLRGWLRRANRVPAPLVLYFGGNAEEVSGSLRDPRWPRDVHVAAVNYRGYGESEGKPSERALVADAIAIRDALASRNDVDAGRIVAFGRSLGTGVAVGLAAARPVAAVVLASPYDSLAAVGRTHYPWLPVDGLLRHRFDAASAARTLRVPLLALVAERDAIIPIERSRALVDAWAGPKRWIVVPGTDHDTLSMPDAFWQAVDAFVHDAR